MVNESKDSEGLVLGMDIGTTSIKVSLLRKSTKEIVESFRCETSANISGEESNFAEQDVTKILSVLQHALDQLSSQLLAKVSRIGICGQMHGCLLWKEQTSLAMAWGTPSNNVSNLITWEDRRCTNEFLSTLPPTHTNVPISTGFGCASLFWLKRNHLSLLERYDCAGTIMDFIVCLLCQMDKPLMSSQNAVSWGYFDVDNMTWELDLLKSANFPTHLLPVVVVPGAVAGKLQKPFLGIPAGIPVGVALGDFQCSVLSSISWQNDAVLNVSTSCQLAVVVPDNTCNISTGESHGVATDSNALKVLPFFKGKKVITAASLSGGNILATYVKMLMSWMEDLGLHGYLPSTDEIYQRVLDCADRKSSTSLKIIPTLWGERHTPNKQGQVSNVTSNNISLGDVGVALCQGLVENLEKMMSKEFLHVQGVQRIVGTGSALMKNRVLQKQVEQVFELPLVMSECSEASVGAALAAILETI